MPWPYPFYAVAPRITQAEPARIVGTIASPYNLEPGDTLSLALNGGAPVVGTVTATAAADTSGAEPWNLDGQSMTVSFSGGPAVPISFAGGDPWTAADVAALVNPLLNGGAITVTGGTMVTLTSDRRGSGASLTVSGAAATTLGLSNATGTGNVADVDAVTAAELAAIMQAAADAATQAVTWFALSNGFLGVQSVAVGGGPPTLQVSAGVIQVATGLPTTPVTGREGILAVRVQIGGRPAMVPLL